MYNSFQSGFSLVELIIAVGLFIVLISGVTYLSLGSYDSFFGTGNSREMKRIAEEAVEVLQVIKERSWLEIAENSSDSPSAVHVDKDANGIWQLESGTETLGSFTRSILIYNVDRNSDGGVVTAGTGIDDPATKRIVVTISATGREDFVIDLYLSNWETYRLEQTDWSGSAGTDIWTEGSTDYYSETFIDVANELTVNAL